MTSSSAPAARDARDLVDRVRQILWDHFVDTDQQMVYDYWWGAPGFRWLPTAQEIAREYPNAAGWGTGMENCALNAAQVLPGALLRHELSPDTRSVRDARALFLGIQRLFDAAAAPGFLPRGLAPDGVSHYPNSSADQYTMVLYALHAYHGSSIATETERDTIRRIWHDVLTRWERDGWEDRREDGGPAMFGDMNRISPDRAPRLLAALRGGHDVTGDDHWRDVYEQKLEEANFARLRTGLPPAGAALYVYDQNQVAWHMLWSLESDDAIKRRYRTQLRATAEAVTDRLRDYKCFDRDEHRRLTKASRWDWRLACVSTEHGANHGAEYNARLRNLAPVSLVEHELIQTPWEAAHILALSQETEHHHLLLEHLPRLLAAFEWDHVSLSWSLYDVEWTYWLALKRSEHA